MLALCLSCTTKAETESEAPTPSETIDEITVVGSLIRRAEVYEGRAPVQSLDAEAFKSIGAAQLVDVLANLTANTGSYLATQQTYVQGSSQFSLRGVGLSSTLTLINGRRAGFAPISNDVGQSFFDINSIPMLMIDRVEILRDGAAATYGSQAVAGVANLVTRSGFSGFELAGGLRDASNTAYDLGFAAGKVFARGHLNAYGLWYQQDENFRTDFDWMVPRAVDPNGDGDIVDGSFDSGRGSPGSFRRAMVNPDGSYSPFRHDGVVSPLQPDADCSAAGGYPSGRLCRMNFIDQRTMVAAEQRGQLFLESEIDVGNATLFSELGYSANTITDRVGNMLLFNGNVSPTNDFFVPANHPFNFWTDPDGDGELTYVEPSAWDPVTHEAVPLGYFGRPVGHEAAGDNAGDEVRTFDTVRFVVGFEAPLARGWMTEGHFGYAQTDLAVASDRHWVAAEFANVLVEGLWNPFGTRLVASDLVTPKTVADDGLATALVGRRAGNDAATMARFESVRRERAESVQNVAEVVATRQGLGLLGFPVTLALGTQYRELSYWFEPDPLNFVGAGPQRFREFPAAGDVRAWAVFAENLTQFGDRAELQLAARHESYDRAGDSTDPKIAAQFFATDRLSLRASWGTSFQAPSVFQAAGNTSSRTISDPFRFDDQGTGSCTVDATGSIIERGDNFAVVTMLQGSDLNPQTATSANFGVLLRPADEFALSVDYWTLDYRDVIAQGRSFQAIVDDDCRDDGMPNDDRVMRDTSGQISVVATAYENVGAVDARGFDMNAHFDVNSPAGDIRFSVDATLLTRFDVKTGGEGFQDRLGNRNNTNGFAPTPELRLNVGVGWTRGQHAAKIATHFVDSYKNDEVATLPVIASWATLDANYSYEFEDVIGGDATLYLGSRNLLDNDPPPLPNGRNDIYRHNLRPGFDGFVHDIKGRIVYMRFLYRR